MGKCVLSDEITLSGKVIAVRLLHPENALFPMEVKCPEPSLKTTLVISSWWDFHGIVSNVKFGIGTFLSAVQVMVSVPLLSSNDQARSPLVIEISSAAAGVHREKSSAPQSSRLSHRFFIISSNSGRGVYPLADFFLPCSVRLAGAYRSVCTIAKFGESDNRFYMNGKNPA